MGGGAVFVLLAIAGVIYIFHLESKVQAENARHWFAIHQLGAYTAELRAAFDDWDDDTPAKLEAARQKAAEALAAAGQTDVILLPFRKI